MGRSHFCGTSLRVTPSGRYPPPCPAEPGRSSGEALASHAAAWPTHPLRFYVPGLLARAGRPPIRSLTGHGYSIEVLILLPPSEGKTAAGKGRPLDLTSLAFPELTDARAEVLGALSKISAHDDAKTVLKVGESLAHEVSRNIILHELPAAPAHSVYSGVLYDALGYRTMTPTQKRKADAAVVVVSALWGAVGFADALPAYRLSMSVDLPGVGKLAAFWRERLTPALDERAGESLIVDCRSSTYSGVWSGQPERTVAVNVFQERNGQRTVVSHFAKHTRGELARHLLTRRGKQPATPEDLLRAASERWTCELVPAGPRKAAQLNIVLQGGEGRLT